MTRPGTFYHIIVYSVLLLCVSGCGIFTSGTWEDDDGNWERAFASTKPDGVIILHSRYWRSSHWSYEFAYFFEIECNDEFKEQLIAQNNLNKLGDEYVERLKNETFDEAPEWFAPKDAAEYEVWILEASNFRLFVDKETCTLFLTDYTI